jgi:uracil phosphoribosyltransferase
MIMPVRELTSIEKRGGRVFVCCTAVKQEKGGKTEWLITAPSPMVGHKIFANLRCPLPPTWEEGREMGEEKLLSYNHQYDRYKEAVEWLDGYLLGVIADNLFGSQTKQAESRLGQDFAVSTMVLPKKIVLGEIARGGSKPTRIAERWFRRNFLRHVPNLYAASQRVGARDSMGAEAETKGRTDLTGATLIILEQALATCTTIEAVVRKWIARCESVPDRIVIGAYHAAHESLRRIQNMGAEDKLLGEIPVDVVALVVHDGINEMGYLVGPGCGDVGVMDVGLRDK